ncbi:hypothetical protein BPAE_0006g00260 [Botrytis paeoniae]|uniref:Uncharacterized protein n=1 Tax=Botrytis paeoniae TaxID=278948 RepID=A0A4Z1FZU7_9HELO|nr:hypothetical protein BPAE_0006g00260 [Botrytis paeoniae]
MGYANRSSAPYYQLDVDNCNIAATSLLEVVSRASFGTRSPANNPDSDTLCAAIPLSVHALMHAEPLEMERLKVLTSNADRT